MSKQLVYVIMYSPDRELVAVVLNRPLAEKWLKENCKDEVFRSDHKIIEMELIQ